MPWRDKSIAHIHYPVRAHGGSTRRDFSRQKNTPLLSFCGCHPPCKPTTRTRACTRTETFRTRHDNTARRGERLWGGRLGVCGLVDSAAQILCPTWQRKNPATWQRKQAGIDHKENQKVRKHEQRKEYCARAITILLVEARAVHSSSFKCPCCCSSPPRKNAAAALPPGQCAASMLLLGPFAASPDVVYIQEEHRRRR